LSHSLTYWITENEISIIIEKLALDKRKEDLGDYMLNFFKNNVIQVKAAETTLLKKYEITAEDIEKVKMEYDDKFEREGAQKKAVGLYGDAIYDGLLWITKFQYKINSYDNKELFKSVDDFLATLIKEHVELLKTQLFAAEVDKDYKKSRALKSEQN